jgi:hypothetical protein
MEPLTGCGIAVKRLISYLGGIGAGALLLTGSDGSQLDIADVHIATMRHAQKTGMIRKSLDPLVLGTLVTTNYTGALLRWSYGGIDDANLVPIFHLGLVTVAVSGCTSDHRTRLERELLALHRKVTLRS